MNVIVVILGNKIHENHFSSNRNIVNEKNGSCTLNRLMIAT